MEGLCSAGLLPASAGSVQMGFGFPHPVTVSDRPVGQSNPIDLREEVRQLNDYCQLLFTQLSSLETGQKQKRKRLTILFGLLVVLSLGCNQLHGLLVRVSKQLADATRGLLYCCSDRLPADSPRLWNPTVLGEAVQGILLAFWSTTELAYYTMEGFTWLFWEALGPSLFFVVATVTWFFVVRFLVKPIKKIRENVREKRRENLRNLAKTPQLDRISRRLSQIPRSALRRSPRNKSIPGSTSSALLSSARPAAGGRQPSGGASSSSSCGTPTSGLRRKYDFAPEDRTERGTPCGVRGSGTEGPGTGGASTSAFGSTLEGGGAVSSPGVRLSGVGESPSSVFTPGLPCCSGALCDIPEAAGEALASSGEGAASGDDIWILPPIPSVRLAPVGTSTSGNELELHPKAARLL